VECVDWTGGQIKNDDSSEDVKNVDLSQVHYLSGPVEIEGAKAGQFFDAAAVAEKLVQSLDHTSFTLICIQVTSLK
jgi:acetamidase/formamidase